MQSLHPPRSVRNFRLARVVDGQHGDRQPNRRVGMINIWDSALMPSDALKEAQRYIVGCLDLASADRSRSQTSCLGDLEIGRHPALWTAARERCTCTLDEILDGIQ